VELEIEKQSLFMWNVKAFKTLLVLTLLFGDCGTPPTSAKELHAAYTTPILAMKLDVLLHGSWNVFMLIVVIETHPAWPPPT